MLLHYLKYFFRRLFQKKLYLFICTASLSVGSVSLLLLLKDLEYEAGFDKFHNHYGNIYRIVKRDVKNGETFGTTPYRLAEELKNTYPEIKSTLRLTYTDAILKNKDIVFREEKVVYADKNFFNFFSFELQSGNKNEAMSDPYSIIISREIAEKYFGKENPVGKILNVNNKYDLKITGVFKEIPKNTHLDFRIIIPMDIHIKRFRTDELNNWYSSRYYTYILTNHSIDSVNFNDKLNNFVDTNFKENESLYTNFIIQKLSDIRMHSENIKFDTVRKSRTNQIAIIMLLCVSILVIAISNYINITTGIADTRGSEISIRKTFGAKQKDIFYQIQIETLFQAIISTMIAAAIIEIFQNKYHLVYFEDISFTIYELILPIILTIIALGLIAGIYPALYMSSLTPLGIIRKNRGGYRKPYLRKFLILFQFIITIILIVLFSVVGKQTNYLLNKDLGFDRQKIIAIDIPNGALQSRYESLRNNLMKHPDIKNVCGSEVIFPHRLGITSGLKILSINENCNKDYITGHVLGADYNFIPTYGLKIISGRNFSKEYPSDNDEAFIVNEAMVKAMKVDNPLGLKVQFYGKTGTIIGVVKDFHFWTLHEKIEPVVLLINIRQCWNIIVKFNTDERQAKKIVESEWNKFAPEFPFSTCEINFKEKFADLYSSEVKLSRVIEIITIFSLVLASLGLFGLLTFLIKSSLKEIGIRKILGASGISLIILLLKEFYNLSLVAALIAIPIAYYLSAKWLSNFIYRINMGYYPFIEAVCAIWVMIFVLTCYHVWKASKINPVKIIKYE
ncbi:MAG: ABC transporter permease [Ignavibacteriales bacterium]